MRPVMERIEPTAIADTFPVIGLIWCAILASIGIAAIVYVIESVAE